MATKIEQLEEQVQQSTLTQEDATQSKVHLLEASLSKANQDHESKEEALNKKVQDLESELKAQSQVSEDNLAASYSSSLKDRNELEARLVQTAAQDKEAL